jgi:hypothetical protein
VELSRRIVTRSLQTTAGQEVDDYPSRVVKSIPADVVAAWLAITALLGGTGTRLALLWVVFVVLVAVTPLWTLRTTRDPQRPPAWLQAAVSTLAFVVWAFATGEPFSQYAFYDPAYGGVALILFSLLSGLVDPDRRTS